MSLIWSPKSLSWLFYLIRNPKNLYCLISFTRTPPPPPPPPPPIETLLLNTLLWKTAIFVALLSGALKTCILSLIRSPLIFIFILAWALKKLLFNVSYLGPYKPLLFNLLSGAQRSPNVWLLSGTLIVMGFSQTSTLVGHFVLSPRAREKRDRRDSRGSEREGQGRNRNETEETEETRNVSLRKHPYSNI